MIAALALATLWMGAPAWADWQSPTSSSDCLQPALSSSKQAASKRASQCFSQNWYTRGNTRQTFVCALPSAGGYAYGDRYEIPSCSGTWQSVCEIDAEIVRRKAICKARLAEYRDRLAAERAEQRELERLQQERAALEREQAQIDRRNAAEANDAGLVQGYINKRYLNDPEGVARLFKDGRRSVSTAAWFARQGGLSVPRAQGGHALSQAFTRAGINVVGRLHGRTLAEFEAALQQYNANNPRPTAAQRDAQGAARADLFDQLSVQALRAESRPFRSALEGMSAVTGSHRSTVLQLVRLRNAGELDGPIANLGIAVTTILAARAYQRLQEQADAQRLPTANPTVSADVLRERRQAALTPLRQERTRIKAEAERVQRAQAARIARQKELDDLDRQYRLQRQQAEWEHQQWLQRQEQQRRIAENKRRERERQIQMLLAIGAGVAAGLSGNAPQSGWDDTYEDSDELGCGLPGCNR